MEDILELAELLLNGCNPAELITHFVQSTEAIVPETAYVVHRSTGRVRLRIPNKRHDWAFFTDVKDRLSTVQGVQRVDVNPATGSVLVRYTGDLAGLIAGATMAGLPELADVEVGLPPIEPVGPRLLGRLSSVNQSIARTTNGTVDGGGAVLMGLLIAGVIQIARGQIFGPAVPLLWYAAQAITGVLPNRSSS